VRIINAMFGRKKGAIEQAFIDYCKVLAELNQNVVALAYQETPVIKMVPSNVVCKTITNFGQFDPLVAWKLKKIVKEVNPDVIITHGTRASFMFNKVNLGIPVVSVLHSYNAKQVSECSNIIVPNDELAKYLAKKGIEENRIYIVPENMQIIPAINSNFTWHEPPVIGCFGRFVAKKGFNVFFKALSILRSKGMNFRAILGGAGTEFEKLKKLSSSLGIDDIVSFPGWIDNKEQFFNSIDIFCMPYLHENKNTAFLEPFMHGLPVVTTDTEAALGMVRPGIDALMVEAGDPVALAQQLEMLLSNKQMAHSLSKEALKVAAAHKTDNVTGKALLNVLGDLISTGGYKLEHESQEMLEEV
jgi:glycosyltransferase involved in cell wall biosynthesis